ncbi:hypothetical protein [Comamonas badia]|uniref:hypothetical protein n=1 Tax=Comamonas badia TaxID=265291 RepID=UPI0012EC3D7E|nr:hypothetical protein [Comamonas badia]
MMQTQHRGATPTPLMVERRFPLDLHRSIQSIRDLYETGKRQRWSPNKDIDWDKLDPSTYSPTQLEAARQVWSRRAWLEYTGLAETPALLIRFCLELDRESDPKYFLTVRNTEEAWHIECFHRYAKLLGGYQSRPANPAWEAVINRTFYRDALNATQSLDAYVATQCALADGLELELYRLYASNAREPVAAGILKHVVQAKERHASFGWLYLEERAGRMDAETKQVIARHITKWVEEVAFSGYHIPSLSSTIGAQAEEAAAMLVAEAGLGAATPETELRTFKEYLQNAFHRLEQLGFVMTRPRHPVLGEL